MNSLLLTSSLPAAFNSRAEQPSLEQYAAAEQLAQVERPTQVEQHGPLNPGGGGLYANSPNNTPFEQHVFVNASGMTMETGFYFNMGVEGLPKTVTKQVAFSDASNMQLKGGVFGMGSASLIAKIAEIQVKREMEKDRLNFKLEMERVAFQRHEMEFKERLAQFDRGMLSYILC